MAVTIGAPHQAEIDRRRRRERAQRFGALLAEVASAGFGVALPIGADQRRARPRFHDAGHEIDAVPVCPADKQQIMTERGRRRLRRAKNIVVEGKGQIARIGAPQRAKIHEIGPARGKDDVIFW